MQMRGKKLEYCVREMQCWEKFDGCNCAESVGIEWSLEKIPSNFGKTYGVQNFPRSLGGKTRKSSLLCRETQRTVHLLRSPLCSNRRKRFKRKPINIFLRVV